jgi:hypothetical protein
MAAKGTFHLNEIAFANHMETKAKTLDPEVCYIGVDFCVMKFAYPYQAGNAKRALERNNDSYDYKIYEQHTKVCIYNQHYYKNNG